MVRRRNREIDTPIGFTMDNINVVYEHYERDKKSYSQKLDEKLELSDDDIYIYHAGANDHLRGTEIKGRDLLLEDLIMDKEQNGKSEEQEIAKRLATLTPYTDANNFIVGLMADLDLLSPEFEFVPNAMYDLRIPNFKKDQAPIEDGNLLPTWTQMDETHTKMRKLFWDFDKLLLKRSQIALYDLYTTNTTGTYIEIIDGLTDPNGLKHAFYLLSDLSIVDGRDPDPFLKYLYENHSDRFIHTPNDTTAYPIAMDKIITYVSNGKLKEDQERLEYEELMEYLGDEKTNPHFKDHVFIEGEGTQDKMTYVVTEAIVSQGKGQHVQTFPWATVYLNGLQQAGKKVTAIVSKPEGSNTYLRAHDVPRIGFDSKKSLELITKNNAGR